MNKFKLPEKQLYSLSKRAQGKAERQIEVYGCELYKYIGDLDEGDQVLCVGEDGMQLLLSGKEVLLPHHILICETEGDYQIIPSKDHVSSRWLKHLVSIEVRRKGL
ncbi:hypothetical protein [Dielma fastidiosa]|uniref:Uncharacterized protein n=1 Tax=Dielma fastidiosa TaxID=1034346 RepID=A0A318KS30_9FIRM|nr:hypothetical protein [Dielma fastidiosa]PXX80520.1 hypothetical protein DES51_103115 [Dielma fastidiosa]